MPRAPSSRGVSVRHLQFAIAGLLVLSVVLCARAGLAAQGPPAWVQDELLVGLRPGVSRAQAEAMHRLHGATLIDEIPQIHVHRIKMPSATLEAVERSLSRQPAVKFVERNHILPPAFVPDDPFLPSQWHLQTIAAPGAWDISQGGPRVIIAILDTGVDMSHPDLAAKLVPGYNFYDNNTNTWDVHGHGTQVAGTAAAIGNNGTGVAGVALENRIMPIRVSLPDGSAFTFTMAQGLTWAVDQGAKVMNLSYAITGSGTVGAAAQYVVGKGGLVVAAAGNCGCYNATPDNPYIVSVSATDWNDNLASFSS